MEKKGKTCKTDILICCIFIHVTFLLSFPVLKLNIVFALKFFLLRPLFRLPTSRTLNSVLTKLRMNDRLLLYWIGLSWCP